MQQSFSEKDLLPSSCDWCPRACGANRAHGKVGVCGASDQILVARAALHFWEEPCISGQAGSGTIFFSHCPLHCVYCQNADIAQGNAGVPVSVERVAQMCMELQHAGALNINMVTPTHYTPLIVCAITRARKLGLSLPIVWNTSGYETVPMIKALAGIVDIYLTDFKYIRSETAQRFSHASDYPEVALAALDAMVAQVGTPVFVESDAEDEPLLRSGVVVRHLVLPGHVEESAEACALLHQRYGSSIRLSVMNQYTPIITREAAFDAQSSELLLRVSDEEYEALLDFLDEIGVQDYYWQDGPAAVESFIPAFDLTGV